MLSKGDKVEGRGRGKRVGGKEGEQVRGLHAQETAANVYHVLQDQLAFRDMCQNVTS